MNGELIGNLFWLAMMGLILWWGWDFIRSFGKLPEVRSITFGTWRDCQHRFKLIEHFLSDNCCAINGRVRCNKYNGHKDQHWGLFPQDEEGEAPGAR